jgi:hypothetical protein
VLLILLRRKVYNNKTTGYLTSIIIVCGSFLIKRKNFFISGRRKTTMGS